MRSKMDPDDWYDMQRERRMDAPPVREISDAELEAEIMARAANLRGFLATGRLDAAPVPERDTFCRTCGVRTPGKGECHGCASERHYFDAIDRFEEKHQL